MEEQKEPFEKIIDTYKAQLNKRLQDCVLIVEIQGDNTIVKTEGIGALKASAYFIKFVAKLNDAMKRRRIRSNEEFTMAQWRSANKTLTLKWGEDIYETQL